jgi:hypothetical protein
MTMAASNIKTKARDVGTVSNIKTKVRDVGPVSHPVAISIPGSGLMIDSPNTSPPRSPTRNPMRPKSFTRPRSPPRSPTRTAKGRSDQSGIDKNMIVLIVNKLKWKRWKDKQVGKRVLQHLSGPRVSLILHFHCALSLCHKGGRLAAFFVAVDYTMVGVRN